MASENDHEFDPKISLLAIGCDHYDCLPDLNIANQSIERVKEIFTGNNETALFSESAFLEVYDSSSNTLREKITQLLPHDSFGPDVIFIYFIGYTSAVGISDLGFCMQDTSLLKETEKVIPTSVIRIKELIDTFKLINITPIFIIDSFYLGVELEKDIICSHENNSKEINKYLLDLFQNDYGFFIVNNEVSETQQANSLGMISQKLEDLFENQFSKIYPFKKFITLFELLRSLKTELSTNKNNFQAYLPSGRFADTQIIKNANVMKSTTSENRYSFSGIYKKILQVLWNEGEDRALTPSEILEKTGSQSAYGNHRKLSYSAWGLVEDSPISNKRKLTEKGRKFIKGEVTIPQVIVVNQKTQESRPLEDCKKVYFSDL